MDTMIFIGLGVVIILFIAVSLIIDIVFISFSNKQYLSLFERLLDKKSISYYKEKFPLVSEEFLKLSQEEQLIENNQEIHEANKRLHVLENRIKELENYAKELEEKIKLLN